MKTTEKKNLNEKLFSQDSSDSCGLCTEIENNDENLEIEHNNGSCTTQSNNVNGRHNVSFDMLSTVSEEASDINSSYTPNSTLNSPPSKPSSSTTMSKPQQASSLKPKHFFAPLSPKLDKNAFQKGGNLDDLLKEIGNLSRDIYHLQILNNQKIMSQSEENINYQPDILATSVSASAINDQARDTPTSKSKPFRSEVSLVLAAPGEPGGVATSNPSLIGFEKFTKSPTDAPSTNPPTQTPVEPTQPPTVLSPTTTQIRKEFIKSPSHSLNELSTNKCSPTKNPPHSKDTLMPKRRSLDHIITSHANERPDIDSSTSLTTNNDHQEHHHGTKHHEKVKRTDQRRVSLFFRRPRKEKKHDDDDMTYNPLFAFDQMKNSQSLRGAITNGKVKKLTMKDSPGVGPSSKFRQRTTDKFRGDTDKFTRKYTRLSIDSGNLESQDSGTAQDQRMSMSDEKGSNNSSSRESSDESFRSRKLSITSNGKKSGEKIPWCACWGNGCF